MPKNAAHVLLCVLLASLAGCTLGPRQIHKGRLQYNEAVQQSFREETLLNLVRLRYRETPEFLSIGGIAAQYTFDGSANGGLDFPPSRITNGDLGGGVRRTERPTISYVPSRGEAFQRGLLAPIGLETLELLARTGWSWERILRTSVQYMNDVDNAISAGGPTPREKPPFEAFRYLAQTMRQLQLQRAIELVSAEREGSAKQIPLRKDQLDGDFVIKAIEAGFRFKETDDDLMLVKNEQYIALVVHPNAKASTEMDEVSKLLNLRVDCDSPDPAVFDVTSAKKGRIQAAFAGAKPAPVQLGMILNDGSEERLIPEDLQQPQLLRTDIVISTRSLLEVMFYLSQGVNVPCEHQNQGLVTLTFDENGTVFDWNQMLGDLFTIKSCQHRPAHAAVAVKHRDYWFYIDERDETSLSTFTLLIELYGIEVRGGGGGGFLYTLGI